MSKFDLAFEGFDEARLTFVRLMAANVIGTLLLMNWLISF